MKVSPHTHFESPLTGSTIATMVDRAKELGRTHIAYTDHGHLSSCLKTYSKAKEKGLKFIPGLEFYFKDSDCPLVSTTDANRCKYFTATVYCEDETAYQELCRLISRSDFPTIDVYEEKQQMWAWKELEYIAQFNVSLVLGGVHCMVGKTMLAGQPVVAENVLLKLKDIFQHKLYTAIICETWTKKWNSVVQFELSDGSKVSCLSNDLVSTDRARRIKASDLLERSYHSVLKSLSSGGIAKEINLNIISSKLYKGFLPLPGGDALLKVNKFLKALSAKHGIPVLVSDYAYYAHKDDKIVQTMRLEGTNKLQPNFYMKSEEETTTYLKEALGLSDQQVSTIFDALVTWSHRFDKLEFKYSWRLAEVGESPINQAMAIIRENGRMKWNDPTYVARLKEELTVIAKNPVKDLTPYFLPIRDVLNHYKENGLLVGPGRGCLTGDAKILCNGKITLLKDVMVGDTVISHSGHERTVTNTMSYDVSEELIEIRSNFSWDTIKLTKDHKLLGVKVENTDIFKKTRSKKVKVFKTIDTSTKSWIRADELKKNDLLFMPWPKNRPVIDFEPLDMLQFCRNDIISADETSFTYSIPKDNELSIRTISKNTKLSRNYLFSLKHKEKAKWRVNKKTAILSNYLFRFGLSIENWINLDNSTHYTCARKLQFDEKTLRVIGRWIGDGWITSKKNNARIGIAFHNEDLEGINEFKVFLINLGIPFSAVKHKTKRLVQITVASKILFNFIKHLFPKYSNKSSTKYLGDLLFLKNNLLRELIIGLHNADGHIYISNKNNKGIVVENITTTSPILAGELKQALLYLNIPSSIQTRKPYNRYQQDKIYKCSQSYKIKFKGLKSPQSNTLVSDKEGYFTKISNISSIYDDKVYDITVEKDNSYSTANYVVHNSAGGSLLCYLLGITQINPFKYDLPFSRFFSMDRIMMKELPDIDVDLESRELLVGEDGKSGYLYKRYGDKAAQISTRTTIRLKSAIKDTNRYFKGKVEPEIDIFSKGLPPPPQGVNDHQFVFGYEDSDGEHILGLIEQSEDLKKYTIDRPEEWAIVSKAMGLTRAFSKHACIDGDTLIDNNGRVEQFKNATFTQDKPIRVWSSGIKDTILVSLNNGISIKCTPDHKFITRSGPVEAKDLLGIEVQYSKFFNTSGTESLSKELLFALGWGLNDGTFNINRTNQCFHFTPDKDDEARARIYTFLQNSGVKTWNGRPDELYCGKTNLSILFFESKRNKEQRLPSYFWKLNFESQCEFMRGFMSANGYILNTRKRVGLKVSSKLLVSDIAVWFNANDIKTSATYGKGEFCEFAGRQFNNNGFAELNIVTYESRKLFYNYVGFEQTYKANRLEEIVTQKNIKDSHSNRPQKIKCIHITQTEPTEVFDFNESQENVGYVNGVLVHNSAFVLSDVPIKDVVPVRDTNVTQYEAKECEAAGLIKYDFLVINQLKDVRVCLDLINRRNNEKNVVGHFTHQGKSTYIWNLPEVAEVFKSVWDGACETLFQINTKSMIPYVMEILPGSVMDLATILALVRPGPMDFIDEKTGRNMVEEYILRKRGESSPDIKELADLLPETFGTICFQEDLNKIARDLAGFPGEKAEKLRKNMAKKKMKALMEMKPDFIAGARLKVSEEVAEAIWDRMITFGRYGFSIIHAVEYAMITYACMFLKHYYPLEWWAAVLTNADEQEITGTFWPHVKDLVSPPDINLSSDTMVVDYANGKIRSKLGVIRGIGEATIEPIVTGRPYRDIQDFVNKEVSGPSLSHKLIHVGVLDSLFPARTNLIEKLKLFENAVEVKKFNDKLEKAKMLGKKVKATQPKEGIIPEGYVNLHPVQDAAMRKSVLPSLPIDLYDLGSKYSKVINPDPYRTVVVNQRGYDTLLINGERLKRLDEMEGEALQKDMYVAATCFIVKVEEFSYPKKNPTKRALKVIADADGFVREYVLWPDYETQELNYPKELKKGVIATLFFRKKVGRKDMNLNQVVVES